MSSTAVALILIGVGALTIFAAVSEKKDKEKKAKEAADRRVEFEKRRAENKIAFEKDESELITKYGPFIQKIRRVGGENIGVNNFVYVFPDSQILLVDGHAINFSKINKCELTDNPTTITQTTGVISTTHIHLYDAVGEYDPGSQSTEYIETGSIEEERFEPTRTTTKTEHHYNVILYLKDIANPIMYIGFSSYEGENARRLAATIEAILAQ